MGSPHGPGASHITDPSAPRVRTDEDDEGEVEASSVRAFTPPPPASLSSPVSLPPSGGSESGSDESYGTPLLPRSESTGTDPLGPVFSPQSQGRYDPTETKDQELHNPLPLRLLGSSSVSRTTSPPPLDSPTHRPPHDNY